MKTGQQKPRLSEKLNADLEATRAEHRDLINSQLERFRNDLTSAANDALTTIDNATERLTTRLNGEKRWLKLLIGASVAATLILLTVVVMTWLEQKTSLARLGIERVEDPEAMYLLLTGREVRLTSCRVGAQMINCIRIGRQ